MSRTQWNRRSLAVSLVLAIAALLLVACTLANGGGREPDEGWQAHLFQLLIVLQLPLLMAYGATVDWARRRLALARLVLPGTVIAVALGTVAAAGL